MRGYVPTRWGQLHYRLEGDAHAPATVVLLHENSVNLGVYERLIPELSRSVRVVALDTPGHGMSDPPPQPTWIEEYALTIAEGLRRLGLGPMVVVGNHTGASIAVELAAVTMPEAVIGLVLSGVPAWPEEVRAQRFANLPTPPDFAEDGSHLVAAFNRLPSSYEPELRSRFVAGVCNDPSHALWGYHAAYSYRPIDVVDKVTCPIALVTSTLDVLYGGDEMVHAAVPASTLVVIPADQMALYWTRPAEYATEILKLCPTER